VYKETLKKSGYKYEIKYTEKVMKQTGKANASGSIHHIVSL